MELAEFVTLDKDSRNDARIAAAHHLVDLHVAEVAVRLRRIEPDAHRIFISVSALGGFHSVELLRIEDQAGKKIRKPRRGLVEQVEALLAYAARITTRWPHDEESVLVTLPVTP